MSHLPVRLRLTLAFALAMAVVLSAVGGFLYIRLGASLLEQLDESLQARAATLATVLQARDGEALAPELAAGDDDAFAQVLHLDGSVLASSPPALPRLLSLRELTRAQSDAYFLEREARRDQPARVYITRVDSERERLVLLVGAPLEDRQDSLNRLLAQLFVVGPLALVVSSLAGYLLAASALRPVEAMRRRAAEISSERPGQRLPLSTAEDEVRRLGETLNAMLGRLEAGLARERRFVADASHELRTPLGLLKTELELALRRPRSSEELAQALSSAAEEVDRLSRLAEDLLLLAQLEDGRLPVRQATISLRELLDTVAQRFAGRAAEARRAIEVATPADSTLVGDRLRLEQALGNLVDNALRYGGGTIRLEAERDADHSELRVSDQGPGFPVEFLPHAFDRFARADEARSDGSAGLGLAIVDAIARAHGGLAQATNRVGNGAVVVLRLPLLQLQAVSLD